MGEAALELHTVDASDPQGWRVRLAQQAFAALLEDGQRLGNFRIAALRASARAALSALSVDDRERLERWLSLQLATHSASTASNDLGALATVETLIAANVRTRLPKTSRQLGLGSSPNSLRAPSPQLRGQPSS